MDNTNRNRILSSVVYIILALCVVMIMCIAIFTVANTGRNKAAPESGYVPVIPEVTAQTPKPVTVPEETTVISTLPEPQIVIPEKVIEETEPVLDVINEIEEIIETEPIEFIMPVRGYVVKGHHADMLVYSLTMNDYRAHQGIDISAPIGAPVFACTNGTIENIYDEPFMGRTVVIDHGGGLKSRYMNLSEDLPQGIEVNAAVEAGQVIAGVGETSLTEMADTVHLHFEMTKDGLQVDPLEYIEIDYTVGNFYEE